MTLARRVACALLPIAAAACGSGAEPARAQSWRDMEVARQLHDSAAYRVRVNYVAGSLELRSAPAPYLYQMRLRYDEKLAQPVHVLDEDSRTLTLGVNRESTVLRMRRDQGESEGELHLALTRDAPIDLALKLGAVEADLDLTGLSLSRVHLESGASDASVRFDAPNPIPMERLELEAGAASLRATGLAFANPAQVRVDAGVGSVELDFSGEWTRDTEAVIEVALGGVEVRVPRAVGVRVELERFLAGFKHDGLERRGDAYYSDNWDSAARRLRIRAETVFGSIEIRRIQR
jgi:hypothetical protein